MKRKLFVAVSMWILTVLIVPFTGAEETIKIGSPLLLSGHGAFVGGSEKKTLEMATKQQNDVGGINGRPIEFIYYDTEMKPDTTVRLVNRLIKKDKVDAILGISTSWTAMPVIPILEKQRVPTIMLGQSSAITQPVRSHVFKIPADEGIIVPKLLSHMQGKGIKRLAIITSLDQGGDAARNQFISLSPIYDIKIVFDERYNLKDTDITPTLGKIRNTDAQAVANWSGGRAQVVMTMNYRQLGIELPLYHGHAALSQGFLKALKDMAEGVFVAATKFYGAQSLPDVDPQKKVIIGYQTNYKTEVGEPANQFGACAFDGFHILKRAMEIGGTDKAKVRDAIEQTKVFVGVNGIFSYSPDDHAGISKDSAVIYQVVDGRWKMIL